jgi:hypothetical protein
MIFHKKISLIFFALFFTVLFLASLFKLTAHSVNKITLVPTVYADNWWEDWGSSDGGDENTDPGRDNWWEDEEQNNDNGGNDEDQSDQCQEESWTDEQTSGEFYCNDGKACYKQWRRDSSCNIQEDGEDCQSDSRCQEEQNNDNGDDNCPFVRQYPECQADGQVYEAWQNCRGEWDPRPTGQSCDADGDGDQEEQQGSCGDNQYWDTETGQCVVNDLAQTQENDEIYCRDQCGGSCAGPIGAKYCTNEAGDHIYDCNNIQDQWVAECQNQIGEEFLHVGIDPDMGSGLGAGDLAATEPLCRYADLDSGECRGSQYCQTHILYCDGLISGNPEIGGNCNLVPGLCGVAADANGNLYVERPACNPECGANEQCMDDGNGAGFCQANANIPASFEPTPEGGVPPEIRARCEGTDNPDRVEECIQRELAKASQVAPVTQAIPERCRDIINPDRLDECIQRETGQPAGGLSSDASCQAQTPKILFKICIGHIQTRHQLS